MFMINDQGEFHNRYIQAYSHTRHAADPANPCPHPAPIQMHIPRSIQAQTYDKTCKESSCQYMPDFDVKEN